MRKAGNTGLKTETAEQISAEELVARYSKTIYRIALARLGNHHEAEDITQDVLLKYIKADITFNDEDHRRKWLIKVAVNAVNSLATSAWKRHTADISEAYEIPDSDSETQTIDIRSAVMQLPEKYRVPIHLFYYENFSVREIAEITSSSEGTVKSQLSRARAKLKELLEE